MCSCTDMASRLYPPRHPKLSGPSPPSLGKVIPSRAVNPVDSRAIVATASQGTVQATARTPTVPLDRPKTQSMALSQVPRHRATGGYGCGYSPQLSHGQRPNLAMAHSQLLATPREVTVAVLRATTRGSPTVGAWRLRAKRTHGPWRLRRWWSAA